MKKMLSHAFITTFNFFVTNVSVKIRYTCDVLIVLKVRIAFRFTRRFSNSQLMIISKAFKGDRLIMFTALQT
jgi:hypothetical protein